MPKTVDREPTLAPLPTWVDRYTTIALWGLVLGTALALFAFLTNPIPDPSFPWATLPDAYRLPFEQPRIEHWPVTYSVGIWLWIAGFPAVFFAGYRRYRTRTPYSATIWLVGLPTTAMFAWTTYCRFFWPKLHPPTWNAPAYTLLCWVYCSTYDVLWSNLAYAVVALGVLATLLCFSRRVSDRYALLGFGVLAFPLGLPAVYAGSRRLTGSGR